jgi:D-alanine--poly(phosphoribitol) ligase subunit 2
MPNDSRQQIWSKVVQLAHQLGKDGTNLRFDEEIPATGLLDSAAIMELIIWFEGEYGLTVLQEDLTLANFGTVDAMAGYLARVQALDGNP